MDTSYPAARHCRRSSRTRCRPQKPSRSCGRRRNERMQSPACHTPTFLQEITHVSLGSPGMRKGRDAWRTETIGRVKPEDKAPEEGWEAAGSRRRVWESRKEKREEGMWTGQEKGGRGTGQ